MNNTNGNDTTKNAFQSRRISADTITKINRISPDDLIEHGIIQRSSRSGYDCPCGNGTGAHGTGMELNPKVPNKTSFHCFTCGNSFNVLQLCARYYGLELRGGDFISLVEKICADFEIEIEYEEFALTNSKRSAKKSCKRRERPSHDEIKNIQEDLNASTEPLEAVMKYRPAQKWRGFDLDFLLKHGCRLINGWTHPKYRNTNKQERTPTMRMIIPAGNLGYLARLFDDVRSYDTKAQQYIRGKEKMHAGRKDLFGAEFLNSTEPIFCFEGYIDAMSAELVGFKAVALGGKGEGDLIISAVDNLTPKPQIIILLDPDGAAEANQLRADLLAVKCPCVVRFLSKPTQGRNYDDNCASGSAVVFNAKIDANFILQNQGEDVLRIMLQDILDDSLAELNAVEALLAKKDDAGLSDEDWDFIFSGDPSDLDFARRLERFCGSYVRWLMDAEYWLTYNKGVWQRGSEKNSVVAPFARKLADAMIQNATEKDERALANKFKSSKKIGSAITLLKACDSILITADDLDKHTNLICVQNGVVDLQDKKLYPFDSKYLITQQCRASYLPNAQSDTVDNFLKSIQPDDKTRAGLIRWLAYCLTGEVSEEKFMVWTGGGGNGKGCLSSTVLELFGSYGVGLAPTALLKSGRPFDADKPTTALNGIELARFAISEEMPANGELDTSLIKNLTGGDRINLRRLHCEYKTVNPTVKINLSGNYTPKIENIHDDGLLRRMLNMYFPVKFGTPDNPADFNLKKKLLLPENLNAFLRLFVDEASLWYTDGLIISDEMKKATQDSLDANDFISDFISDNYELGENLSVKAKDFINALKQEYPSECRRFNKRDDLINLVAKTEGITYDFDRTKTRVFKGIGKAGAPQQQSLDDFNGTPIDENDLPL